MENNQTHENEYGDGRDSILRETIHRWLGLFIMVVAAILVYLIANNANNILDSILGFLGLIKPVIYGGVIAYILNPLMKWIRRKIIWVWEKSGKKISEKGEGMVTGISIFASLVFMICVIMVLSWLVIPQLVTSISSLVDSMPDKVSQYYYMLDKSIRNNECLADKFQDAALGLADYTEEMVESELLPWIQSDLLPSVNTLAVQFANGLMGFLTVLYNLFIGIIVAIYLLGSKKTFSAQAKKMLYALCKKEYADVILHYVKITDHMFSGFIVGKIVDSAIMGVICFCVMQVFGLPYAMLVSVIVGVTNIIPVFGPYIGLIPSVFLILLVSPMQALYFIIIIAILQQIDGNIIGPAILGESTGLSAFWVLFSILLFGGIWGIVGMIIGVPLFAVIYRIVADFINWKLRKRKLSTVTDCYRNLKEIQVEGERVDYIAYTSADFEKKRKSNDPTMWDKCVALWKEWKEKNRKKGEKLDDRDKDRVK